MTGDRSYTAAEIAMITKVHKTTIIRRASKESWSSVKGNGKGGTHARYPLPALPQDVQLAIYNNSAQGEGAFVEMLPALSPAVALAVMQKQAAAPSLASTVQPKRTARLRREIPRAGSLLPEMTPATAHHHNIDTGAEVSPVPAHNNNSARSSIDVSLPNCAMSPAGFTAAVASRPQTSLPAPLLDNGGLAPSRRYAFEDLPAWSPERAISADALKNHRVARILAILRDVEAMPVNWDGGANAWKKYVAEKHDVALQSVYRYIDKYDKRGIAGLEHRKSNAGKTKAWTPEALDFWIGLCLKPTQRKMDLKAIYEDALIIEAQRRGWIIGCYESASWWFRKKANPLLLAMRDGGMRAADNLFPPVLRSYADLAPFEMLVGDQHRFDFWVVDDDTGDVFRPECFLWQDLRTRVVYGMAFDKHYDAHLCGLALRVGMRIFGCFTGIYTDNGRPELSKYMMGILSEIRSLGAEWNLTEEAPMDILDTDPEDINPVVSPVRPGAHKKAIVKNAKAKMIEGTFGIFEGILRSRFRLPGSVKRLTDDTNTQDTDHEEALRLAKEGKLLLASEFYLTCYQAADWYNREKAHRGVRREWIWSPKPATATPYQCLMACYQAGWRPRYISDEAADHIFLRRESRTVRLGRVTIDNEIYEHDALLELHQQRVACRFSPLERDVVLVYAEDGRFLCAAHPVEYSSMKDDDLARRKIVEKRAKRKAIADKFRAIIKDIPDLRHYSEIPEAERVAARVGDEKRRIDAARANLTRALPPEELAAEVAKLEALNERMPDGRIAAEAMTAAGKPLPQRPNFFISNTDRYLWCVKREAAGGELAAEDREFVTAQEAAMTPDERERWQFEREYGNG